MEREYAPLEGEPPTWWEVNEPELYELYEEFFEEKKLRVAEQFIVYLRNSRRMREGSDF